MEKGVEPKELTQDPEYNQRVEYLGDQNQNCSFRIRNLRETDSKVYFFRVITNKSDQKWFGEPGVNLTVTDLEMKVNPETVTEGQNVTLTCNTICTLSDKQSFIWYQNNRSLPNTNTTLALPSVTSEDTGSYSCAVEGYETLPSPAATLSVTYAPKNTSVSVSPSGEIVEGSSVTLTCSSNANPPVENYTWFKENGADTLERGLGLNYTISTVKLEDSGLYFCMVKNNIGIHNSSGISLFIKGKQTAVLGPVVGVTVTVTLVLLAIFVFLMRRQSSTPKDKTTRTELGRTEANQKDNDSTVYSKVAMTHSASREKRDGDNEEEIQYAAVQFPRSTHQEDSHSAQASLSCNQEDVQYASIRFPCTATH